MKKHPSRREFCIKAGKASAAAAATAFFAMNCTSSSNKKRAHIQFRAISRQN